MSLESVLAQFSIALTMVSTTVVLLVFFATVLSAILYVLLSVLKFFCIRCINIIQEPGCEYVQRMKKKYLKPSEKGYTPIDKDYKNIIPPSEE